MCGHISPEKHIIRSGKHELLVFERPNDTRKDRSARVRNSWNRRPTRYNRSQSHRVVSMDGRLGFKVGQIGPKWDKFGAFSDQISVHLAPRAKCTEI